SSSGVTERQIRWALAHGFEGVPIDVAALSNGESAAAARAALLKPALRYLKAGKSVVLHRAPGPAAHREELGRQMGKLLRDLLMRSGVKRVVIVGGDTASHAARELGVYALTMLAPIAPGAPLCRAHSDDAGSRGLELAIKAGHIGPKDFFGAVRAGKSG
ncbi:MAG TPA: nucleotide-binding domain containing protein, partial [Bryobacteraceae bacterium]|nr:nucleotide-binding domain containing protein [Bryobacteraceae bacterium]